MSNDLNKPKSHRCKCRRRKCQDNNTVVKAVFPRVLLAGNDVDGLEKITSNSRALQYTEPLPEVEIFNPENVINFHLDLAETGDVKNIDHIDLDLHVKSEFTQDVILNMYLTQTVELETIIDDVPTLVHQAQQYLYRGHAYTLEGRKWSKIGERWDRPRKLGILRATNLSLEAPLKAPQLQISLMGVHGKLIVDNTLQLHVEYCRNHCHP